MGVFEDAVKKQGARVRDACPRATQDVGLNLQNRQRAIETAMYGPANPQRPGAYFEEIAAEWSVPVEQAMTMRCGNCRVFVVAPKMQECIQTGMASDGGDKYDEMVASQLGYCEMFDFKCAASRTCRAWVTGGPITEDR